MTMTLCSPGGPQITQVTNPITPDEIKDWLEWAGTRILALPTKDSRPQEPKVIWPEYSQEKFQVLEFRGKIPLKALGPSREEIPIMDLILQLPNLCAWQNTRRVLHLRSLVHPLSGNYIYKWARIARAVSSDPRTVKLWHQRGLVEVTRRASPEIVCRIKDFLAPSPDSP